MYITKMKIQNENEGLDEGLAGGIIRNFKMLCSC